MARPIRILYPGAIYHVTTRGHERKELFHDDSDWEAIQQKLAVSLERYQVRLYAYVFMRNHLHLLVETPRANLSRFMQHFSTAYTVTIIGATSGMDIYWREGINPGWWRGAATCCN